MLNNTMRNVELQKPHPHTIPTQYEVLKMVPYASLMKRFALAAPRGLAKTACLVCIGPHFGLFLLHLDGGTLGF